MCLILCHSSIVHAVKIGSGLRRKIISANNIRKTSTDTLTNFCQLYQQVEIGKFNRETALKGRNISVGIPHSAVVTKTGKINEMDPYIAVEVFDEVARRAQFSWKPGVSENGSPAANQTYTDMLVDSVNSNDISVDWWLVTEDRTKMGITFTREWYDSSTIMIVKKAESKTYLFGFIRPFTVEVWIVVVFTIVLTGIVYYIIDYMTHRGNKQEMEMRFVDSLFSSFKALTGHCDFDPQALASKILLISLCFFFFIFTAAYTANMAAFLVQEKENSVTIVNFEDAVSLKMRVCVMRGYSDVERIKEKYPQVHYLHKETDDEIFNGLKQNECDLGLINYHNFFEYENPGCQLEWIGRRVGKDRGAFALRDSVSHCTSLLRDVIDFHLLTMIKDGKLDEIMKSHQSENARKCNEGDGVKKDLSGQLDLKSMSGIIICHVSLMFLAFLVAVLQLKWPKYFHWCEPRVKIDEKRGDTGDRNGKPRKEKVDRRNDIRSKPSSRSVEATNHTRTSSYDDSLWEREIMLMIRQKIERKKTKVYISSDSKSEF